jgi:hypothetical protein
MDTEFLAAASSVWSPAATLAILIASDRQPVDSWGLGILPAVYLSIVSATCNALLAYALVDGLVILFWRRALQGHTASIN